MRPWRLRRRGGGWRPSASRRRGGTGTAAARRRAPAGTGRSAPCRLQTISIMSWCYVHIKVKGGCVGPKEKHTIWKWNRYRDEPSEPLRESTPASAPMFMVHVASRWHAEQRGGTYPAFVQGLAKLPYLRSFYNSVAAVSYIFCLKLNVRLAQPGKGNWAEPCIQISKTAVRRTEKRKSQRTSNSVD